MNFLQTSLPLIGLLGFCLACNFQAQVRSETDRDVWAQFTWPNKTESEIFKLSKFGQTRNFTVTGTLCNLAPTVLKASFFNCKKIGWAEKCRSIGCGRETETQTSWESVPKKGVKPVGQTSAHLEGNGIMFYKIFAKDGPAAVRAEGMLCGWGQCRLG
uniref:Uncharacterized protein n=1 Tax=Caenorhabditis japonica TaxID=281687 RepID=A0A8R1DGR7_CAEJA